MSSEEDYMKNGSFNVKCRRKFSKERQRKIEREKEKEKERKRKEGKERGMYSVA